MKKKITVITFVICTLFLSPLLVSGSSTPRANQTGNTFIAGQSKASSTQTLDPAMALAGADTRITTQVTEPLFRIDRNQEGYPLVGILGTQYLWQNDTCIDIYLRENVKFQDGTAFNASSVAWNFERIQNINAYWGGPYANLFQVPTKPFEDVLPFNTNTGSIDIINSSEVVDTNIIRFHLNVPYGAILSLFSCPAFSIVSPTTHADCLNKTIDLEDGVLVGTGPFKFVSHSVPNMETIFEGFDDYWRGAPYIDHLIYQYIEDPTTLDQALLDNTVDTSWFDPNVLDAVKASPNVDYIDFGGDVVDPFTQLLLPMNALHINQTIRQAMSHCYNYSFWLHDVVFDQEVRTGGAIPSGCYYSNPSIGLPQFNISEARQILIDAGIAPAEASGWSDAQWESRATTNPFANVTALCYGWDMLNVYPIFSQGMALAGMKLNYNLTDYAAYLGDILGPEKPYDIALFIAGIVYNSLDPYLYLRELYYSTGSLNLFKLNDTLIDQWLDDFLTEKDPDQQQAIMDNIADRLNNELCPCIYISQIKYFTALNSEWTADNFFDGSFFTYHRKDANWTASTLEGVKEFEVTSVSIPGFTNFGIFTLIGMVSLAAITTKKRFNKK